MCGMSQPISIVKATGLKIYNQQIYNRKKESDLTRLRHELASVAGHDKRLRLPLGIDSLDRALAGGLALGRVHLLSGAMQTHGAVSGFTIALLCMLQDYLSVKKPINNTQSINYPNQDTSPIIWCPTSQRGGAGMLYGHGLAAAGLDPARLLIVDTPSPSRRLAALDDILRTEGLTAVVIEYDGLKKSVEERHFTLEKSFSEKLNKTHKKISVIASDTEKKISETALNFENRNEILETEVNKQLENTELHLKNIIFIIKKHIYAKGFIGQ